MTPNINIWGIYKGEATKLRQLKLILHYQRLYLNSLFLSGQSDHPLLAIHTSNIMSKPLHPQIQLYYTTEVQKSIYNKIHFGLKCKYGLQFKVN